MKPLKIALLLCTITFLISCKGETKPENAADAKTEIREADPDRQEITRLVKDMYKWHDTVKTHNAFRPFIKDSLIVGYDRIGQSLYVMQLDNSGYFANEFMDNMAKIFNKQDELLRSGEAQWHEGDMPPFGGSDVNPWCNCQDQPTEDYDKIHVVVEKMTDEAAEIYWNWTGFGEDREQEHYHIRVVREKGKWKIAWMEGWDYETNVKLVF